MKKVFYLLVLLPFISCKKDKTAIIPPTTISYSIADTMKLNSSYSTNDPTFYTNYNSKIYSNTINSAIGSYSISGNDIIIEFEDTSSIKGHLLVAKFSNKSLTTISGTYNLLTSSNIEYTQSQKFYNGFIVQPNFKPFSSGLVEIIYNSSTKTINGSFKNVKHNFGVYVPYQYATAGITQTTSESNTLLLNNSNRTYSITFENLKSK